MGDDDLEVEATDFHSDFLEGEAEIRIRGQRQALIGLQRALEIGSVAGMQDERNEPFLAALFAVEAVTELDDQGYDPETLEKHLETDARHQAVETDDIPEMLDVELIDPAVNPR